MNILSQTINNLNTNFNNSIKEYNLKQLFLPGVVNDFNHYLNMVRCIDDVSTMFSTAMYLNLINEIEHNFFNSEYRKKYCEVINIEPRNLITLFGEVRFNRRRYFDKLKNKDFYYIDELLMLPSNEGFDPFVCAKICEVAADESYAKAGRIVSELIGRRLKFDDDPTKHIINRATARNIVLRFKIPELPYKYKEDTPNILYVMMDKIFVGAQDNDNKKHMVKAAVVFEDVDSVYQYKKNKNSRTRFKLINKTVFASIDSDLKEQVIDHFYYTYNTDEIDEIVFMGDCASWVKTFHIGFKFHPKLKCTVAIDGYHYAQSIQHLCTNKYKHMIDVIKDAIKAKDKKLFISLANMMKEYSPHRVDTIEEQKNYILNNWRYIQTYYNKVFVKCSMEAQISHVFAALFTARPRAYSKEGLRHLLKLRLLRANKVDIQKLYFEVLNNEFEHRNLIDYSTLEDHRITSKPKGVQKLFNLVNKNQAILYY